MSDVKQTPDDSEGRDYRDTLYLPRTDFPMRAGLPQREPEILARWERERIYDKLREQGRGAEKFILHDGPPYANGNIHIGTGLNKILKDFVVRSQTMLGRDANYVPGWDCHGLPIEWKIEEEYRAKGLDKDAVPVVEFRRECREFAEKWIDIQRSEFKRLGVEGDWDHPYLTMSYRAEAQIARELMKFAMNGGLYRGSKPVMWSVVEKTALAEAEVEYHDYESDMVWVKFPVVEFDRDYDEDQAIARAGLYSALGEDGPSAEEAKIQADSERLDGAAVVIWTTTPWTIPGNRAISYSSRIDYGLYIVTDAPPLPSGVLPWARTGEKLLVAEELAAEVFAAAKVEAKQLRKVSWHELQNITCAHPLRDSGLGGYGFDVPLLDGEHVTEEAGTGFVHTAPGHGTEDFEVWTENARALEQRGIDPAIPFTVDADGAFTADAPGFTGARVLNDKGKKGDANKAVIDALAAAGMLVARGRLKHQYPHSWRSKAPVIFRNTPQWFIAMDRPLAGLGTAEEESGASFAAVSSDKGGSAAPPLPPPERSAPQATGEGAPASRTAEPPHPSPASPEPTSPHRGEVKEGTASTASSPLPDGERSRVQRAGEGGSPSRTEEAPHPSPASPEPTSPRRGEVKEGTGATLRTTALAAIDVTRFVPAAGQNRLRSMIEQRPDWVISRQRAWGVPITVFTHGETGETIPNAGFAGADALCDRIASAFEAEGADAWFADGARGRFLDGLVDDPADWDQVADILDVWFDSGSTHAFVLEKRPDLAARRPWQGGNDRILYLEGSDQHRGWFHSSLLESCGTRGRAPYDIVVTHGFTMAEDGRKMSKSLGNQVFPQDVIAQNGADILRLWVASTDYGEDQRIGPEILKSNVDAYRKLRNTMRWMLGSLAHFSEDLRVDPDEMPELERYMLHRMGELDVLVRRAYEAFDLREVYTALFNFAIVDLSAFYFDIRKDALYCDAPSSLRRRAALTVLDELFQRLTAWLAPILVFTMEEVWTSRHGEAAGSVHLRTFPETPGDWRNDTLATKWARVRRVRRVVTGALEIERREKRIGSSLEAAPEVHVADEDLRAALDGIDLAEIAITSGATLSSEPAPEEAFTIPEVPGVAVVPRMAPGKKCARSWKVLPEVGTDPDYPGISPRDADAMREIEGKPPRGRA